MTLQDESTTDILASRVMYQGKGCRGISELEQEIVLLISFPHPQRLSYDIDFSPKAACSKGQGRQKDSLCWRHQVSHEVKCATHTHEHVAVLSMKDTSTETCRKQQDEQSLQSHKQQRTLRMQKCKTQEQPAKPTAQHPQLKGIRLPGDHRSSCLGFSLLLCGASARQDLPST